MNLESLLSKECDILESSLLEFGVVAGVRSISVAGSAYVAYELRLGRRQLLAGIEGVLEDVSARIAQHRRSTVRLRLRSQPSPAIEAPHPQPKPLSWKTIPLGGPPATASVGLSYAAGRPEPVQVNLIDTPHVLVAGTTGSGKSTALRAILCGLTWRTPPDDLQVRLIDLKNEALVPFSLLPHCAGVGFTARSAAEQISQVADILKKRIAGASAAQRVVLVIDELAQLDETSKARLGEILALGRSKRVNVVSATQHPTKALVGEKSNYPLRLVGRVTDAQSSALCCGRPGAGAELLPGKGSFLAVGADIPERFQVADFDESTAAGIVGVLRNRWPSTSVAPVPATSVAAFEAENAPSTSVAPVPAPPEPPADPAWPITKRPPTTAEAQAIRRMSATGMSLTKMCIAVYGYKNTETLDLVKGVLHNA